MSLRHLLLSTNLSTKIQSTKNTYRLFRLVKIVLIVTPHTRCRLKLLKLERIKDYLLMEEEFIRNQERLKPQEEKHEVSQSCSVFVLSTVFILFVNVCRSVGSKSWIEKLQVHVYLWSFIMNLCFPGMYYIWGNPFMIIRKRELRWMNWEGRRCPWALWRK